MSKEDKPYMNNIYFGKVLLQKQTNKLSPAQNMKNLDSFLEDEKLCNQNDGWNKLNKTIKMSKLNEYSETYSQQHELTDVETERLKIYLHECLEKKKLTRVKDVLYDKNTGSIKDIKGLKYYKANQRFSLKNSDSIMSTRKAKLQIDIEEVAASVVV
jgi:hypothetical protein